MSDRDAWNPRIGERSNAESLPVPAPRRGAATLLGRAAELSVLQAAVTAARSGHGSIVTVAGEAGIGKTRLSEELDRLLQQAGDRVLWARCSQSEAALPYLPFTELLRELLGSIEPVGRAQLVRPREALLGRLLPELYGPEPAGGAATRVTEPPVPRQPQLCDSVCTLLVEASLQRPIVFVLEDAQWADRPSFQLLRHLMRYVRLSRLVCIINYQPSELYHSPPLLALLSGLQREHFHRRIVLQGLDVSAVRLLIAGICGGTDLQLDDATIAAIVRETGGNPYFVEELLTHLLSNEQRRLRGGRIAFDSLDQSRIGVPEGIRTIIAARISQVSARCRATLVQAAVLGREFEFSVLCGMLGAEDAVLADLEEATLAQIVEELPRRVVPAYTFRHSFLQQMLYEELSLPRRQRLHGRAAAAIESAHAQSLDRQLPALARHYALAGISGDAEKAVEYCLRAADAAQRIFAYEEAGRYLETALEFMEEQGAEPRRRADLLFWLSGLTEVAALEDSSSTRYAERAVALYAEVGDEERAAQARSRLGWSLSVDAESVDARRTLAHFAAAEPVLLRAGGSRSLAYLYTGWSAGCFWAVQPGTGLETARHALAISSETGTERVRNYARAMCGWHLFSSGAIADGLGEIERAWEAANLGDHVGAACQAVLNRGVAAILLGDPREAMMWLRRELRQPRQMQASVQATSLRTTLAWACAEAGELEVARRELHLNGLARHAPLLLGLWEGRSQATRDLWTERWEHAQETGNLWLAWLATFQLGRLLRSAGEFRPAGIWLERGAEMCREQGAEVMELRLRAELGLALVDAGQPVRSREQLARCQTLLSGASDWRGLRGRIELLGAAIAAAEGRLSEAEAAFRTAVRTSRRFGAVWDEVDAIERWACALNASGHERTGGQLFEAASAIYSRAGAGGHWAERLNRLQDGSGRRHDAAAALSYGLSRREVEVIRLICRGRTNRQIGEQLVISANTVARHVNAILRKSSSANRAEAALFALKHGLLE